MKFRLLLNDSEIVEGPDAEAILKELARLQWPEPGKDKTLSTSAAYMIDVSERVKERENKAVRTCCAPHFLEDLVRAGVVEKI